MDDRASLECGEPLSSRKCKTSPTKSGSWQANIAGSIRRSNGSSNSTITTPPSPSSVRRICPPESESAVTSPFSLDPVLFPPSRGIKYAVGSKVRAQDQWGKWYNAKIMGIRPHEGQILVHFDYWNRRFDEWIVASSPRLKPVDGDSIRKDISIEPFEVGDFVLVKSNDDQQVVETFPPAQIVESMAFNRYMLLYDDGSEKVVHRLLLQKMSNEEVQQLDLVSFGQPKNPTVDAEKEADSNGVRGKGALPSDGSPSTNEDKKAEAAASSTKCPSLTRTAPFYYIKWIDPGKFNGKVDKIQRRFIMTRPPFAVHSVVTVRFGQKLLKGKIMPEPKWGKTTRDKVVQKMTDDQFRPAADTDQKTEKTGSTSSSTTGSQRPEKAGQKQLDEVSSLPLPSSRPKSLLTPENYCQDIEANNEEPDFRSLLGDIRSLLTTVVKQNDEMIKMMKSKVTGVSATDDAAVADQQPKFASLVTPSVVLSDPMWQKPIFKSTQVLINKLTCQLASRCFFGDDVLIQSNVTKDDTLNRRRRLDAVKLQQLKETVQKFVGAEEGDLEFYQQWAAAELALQDRIRNLRRRAVRFTTVSNSNGETIIN